ncbi:MAG: N-acetyl-gamma-glutamyl-phosphate reductase [Thermoplasmata archaeon]|nr:N-acetyl-gamma-glutamyl-phosphate reductase [Thermoplasmata archaeon]
MASAAIVGATGYLGTELLRVLSYHPHLTVTQAVSSSHPGESLGDLSPHLERFRDVDLVGHTSAVDTDVAFLAQPPGQAMQVVPKLLERGVKVVDLGPDYRLRSGEEYARVYGQPHADPSHLGEAVYGLPELNGEAVKRARLVANPGCYPTAMLLALAPLVADGATHGPVYVDAKSGSSGAGAGLSTTSHHPEAALTVTPYGSPTHRHVPEMEQALRQIAGSSPPLVFVPHLVPIVRGILCSIYAAPRSGDTAASWSELLAQRYAASPFVHVGPVPKLPWATGTNRCYLSVQSAEGAPVLFSAIDNLGKGGASQAVQNANLMFGWDESAGLAHPGFGV